MIQLRSINDQSIASFRSDFRNYNFDDINNNPALDKAIKDFTKFLYQTYRNCCLSYTKSVLQKKEQNP